MSKILIIGMLSLTVIIVTQIPSPPVSKVTIKVQDEDGNSIPNALVNFAFLEEHPQWGSPVDVAVQVMTDKDGKASGSGYSGVSIACDVSKNGFYSGGPNDIEFKDAVAGKWQPWNPEYKVILKKILNPIPMYAKKVRAVVPAFDQPIGFDLTAGDWVKPFGSGTKGNFIFTLTRTLKNSTDYSLKLTMTFANKSDGIQAILQVPDRGWSHLKFPRNAPEDGYTPDWSTNLNRGAFGMTPPRPQGLGYFFRVETVLQGVRVTQAQYGKIDGNIIIVGAAAEHPGIAFTYYLNPTGTTNLEFDPAKNLLKNLTDDEQVQAP